jgi:hypothetical protein
MKERVHENGEKSKSDSYATGKKERRAGASVCCTVREYMHSPSVCCTVPEYMHSPEVGVDRTALVDWTEAE